VADDAGLAQRFREALAERAETLPAKTAH